MACVPVFLAEFAQKLAYTMVKTDVLKTKGLKMRKSNSTNPVLLGLIEELKKKARAEDAPIWHSLARSLTDSSSRKAQVNISRIARYAGKSGAVAVPGKVLGAGTIAHPVTVAAFNFSKQAREKILSAGGRCISLRDLMSEFPKGSNIKIIK